MTAGTESKTKAKDEAKAGTRGVSGAAQWVPTESKNEGKSAETRAVTEAKSTDEINADSKGGAGAVWADAKALHRASRLGDAVEPTASKKQIHHQTPAATGRGKANSTLSRAGSAWPDPKASQTPGDHDAQPTVLALPETGLLRPRAATPPPSERKKPPTVSALQAEGPASAAESSATLASSRSHSLHATMPRLASEHWDLARAHEQARSSGHARDGAGRGEQLPCGPAEAQPGWRLLHDPESDDGAQGDSGVRCVPRRAR